MEDHVTIREAGSGDAGAVATLLGGAGLDAAGILTAGSRYWVAEAAGNDLVGVVGLEYGREAVLLRSAAVRADMRGRAIGARLFTHAYAAAAADGARSVYCFSTDAGPYWLGQGFCEVPVPELVAALPEAFQVQHYAELGWLPTEVAWRRDLDQPVGVR
jgi:N-acetylglutamate synthase-like GNAT family acetyltransferase